LAATVALDHRRQVAVLALSPVAAVVAQTLVQHQALVQPVRLL
jgi:hypothetical protein